VTVVADGERDADARYRWLRFPVLPGFAAGHPVAALRPGGRALRALVDAPPDLLHLHGYGPLCRQVARALPQVPTVVTVHQFPDGSGAPNLPGVRAALAAALERLLDRCTAVVVPSEAARRRLPPHHRARARVVPTGVAPALVASGGPPQPRGPGPLRVLVVGRRTLEKGFDQVLRLARRHPEARWTAVGGGPVRAEPPLRAIDHVAPPEVGAYYRDADVLFAPSLLETQGLVALEALTLGVPVAAPFGSAQAECVLDGVNGALYAPGDDEAAWRAIEAAGRLGGGGPPDRAVAAPPGFEEAALVRAMAAVYRGALEAPPAPTAALQGRA